MLNKAKLKRCCRNCHDIVEANPKMAKEKGYSESKHIRMDTELKAPPGKFRVVLVDTFDDESWVHGDYDTPEQAIEQAKDKGGVMLKSHVYDDQGKHLYDAGEF
jgi:hypothetical protein